MHRSLLLCTVYCFAIFSFGLLQESEGRNLGRNKKFLLSYKEIQKLPKAKRVFYLKSVAKIFVHLSKSSSGELSWLDVVLSVAYANGGYQFRCIGGGFPVAGSQSNCGVSNFMGFSCGSQEMCNPLIFGLDENGRPHCYANATTRTCYNNLVTGRNSFFTDEWFRSEDAQNAYNDLKSDIDGICSGSASVQERLYYRQEACRMIERQTALNSERSLNNYAVISEDNRGPASVSAEVEGDLIDGEPQEGVGAEETLELAGPRDGNNPCSDPSLSAGLPTGNSGDESTVGSLGRNTGYGSGRDCSALRNFSDGSFTMPSHLANLVPVQMGNVTICVMPDYLSVGSDQSNTRLPLGQDGAIELARETGFMLPTTAMVDAIYRAADVQLPYYPQPPTNQMTLTHYFMTHDENIDSQLTSTPYRPGLLVAGHKKDVVLEGLVEPTVSYYGWNYQSGRVVQPYRESRHGNQYSDYSHGVRFVSQVAFVDGNPVDLRTIVDDGQYNLNREGELDQNDIDYFIQGTNRANQANGCYTPQNSIINPSQYTGSGGEAVDET